MLCEIHSNVCLSIDHVRRIIESVNKFEAVLSNLNTATVWTSIYYLKAYIQQVEFKYDANY